MLDIEFIQPNADAHLAQFTRYAMNKLGTFSHIADEGVQGSPDAAILTMSNSG